MTENQTPDPDNLPVNEVEQTSERTERDDVIYRKTGDENNEQPARHRDDIGTGATDTDDQDDDGQDDEGNDDATSTHQP